MKPIHQQTDAELADSLARAARLPDAPANWVQAAVGLWTQTPTPSLAEAATAVVRHIRAMLSFDSWAGGPLALGLRGGTTTSRHMVFSAEGRDVDLRIENLSSGFLVSGQVLGPDDGGKVELQRDAAAGSGGASVALMAPIDALGEFRFDPVSAGTYLLRLRLRGATVELPSVEVGARRA